MSPSCVLILPGWQNSGPDHWQSRWETAHGYQRVLQHDWMRPLRGDWLIQLEEAVLAAPEPVVLVAHSLGCLQTAAWAAHSQHTARVKAALLVAPPDLDRPDLRELLPTWSPIERRRLPFVTEVLASRDDPYGDWAHAQRLAADWGATLVDEGPRGHLNAESGLGDWPEGHARLSRLKAR